MDGIHTVEKWPMDWVGIRRILRRVSATEKREPTMITVCSGNILQDSIDHLVFVNPVCGLYPMSVL